MSVKRRPDDDLNHDNWQDEPEPEEIGEFQKADEAELRTRVTLKAKRRIRTTDSTDSNADTSRVNVFAGLSALATKKPAFSFSSFSAKAAQGASVLPPSASQFSFTAPNKETPMADSGKSTQFCAKLKELNKAVIDCVQGHINSGKLCILTPIFNDYIKYAKELEEEEPKKSIADVSKSTATPMFSFANTNSNNKSSDAKPLADVAKSDAPAPFSFGKPLASFGSTSTPGAGFFSNLKPAESKPNTLPSVGSEAKTDADADGDENDEPPKVEFTPVVESESIYSKRCKVFVKAGNQFSSRGTGTLYLKSVPENSKVQLIVRADTNLGNILLNILLVEGLPVQKSGENNVMIVCIPTPESEPKPMAVLVRVKTSSEADELLAEIKKHMK